MTSPVFGQKQIPIVRRQDLLKDVEGMMKSFQQKTGPLRKAGTPGIVIPQEELGSFPIKNYAQELQVCRVRHWLWEDCGNGWE